MGSLERMEWTHVVLVGVVLLLAEFVPWLHAWSVAAGAIVMGGNVWLMKGIVRRLLTPGAGERAGVAVLLLIAKFGLLLSLLGLLFWRVPVEGMSFALGISLFLLAALIEAIRASISDSSHGGER